ncbi:MAG: DUF1554 domain-containing protein, partial [Spirochaetia bacterium]|nr:DUF1554 domain-containing protein [Spirochaetia bacterium]
MHFIRITLILSLFLFSTACVQAVRPPHSVNSDEGLLALVFSNIVTSGTTPVAPSSPCNPCKIYVTTQIYNGNLGGVTGADDKCMTNSNKPPDGKTYKAMILDVTNRRACFYGDCLTDPSPDVDKINWVLYPNTDYVRPDGTPIFTSNANAIIILQPGSPGATTLSNPISSITPIAPNVWTGMTA